MSAALTSVSPAWCLATKAPPSSDFLPRNVTCFSISATCHDTDAEEFPVHYVPVPVLSLSRLLQAHEHIDLVSFDCQGSTSNAHIDREYVGLCMCLCMGPYT